MTDWYRKENGEIDREKVIDELERDLVREPDEQTHIIGMFDREAVEGALKLLKSQKQELVVNIIKEEKIMLSGYCPTCGDYICCMENTKTKFCESCGQAVKWDV